MKQNKLSNLLMMGFLLISVVFTSCTNEEDLMTLDKPKAGLVEVSTMGKWTKKRHSVKYPNKRMTPDAEIDEDMPVLHFQNEQAYEYILSQLQDMTMDEKVAFFEELGFEGAFMYMRNADEELDEIFDIEDDNTFLEAFNNYKTKHDGVLVFKDEEEYDLTPSFTFENEEMELLGNIAGYVVIGDELVDSDEGICDDEDYIPSTPGNENSNNVGAGINYGQGPLVSKFMPLRQIIKIRKGKYSSTLEIGYDNISHNMLLHFVSHKHKTLYTRKHPTGYQFDNFLINSIGGGSYVIPNYGKKDYYVNLYGWNTANFNANWQEMTIVNFKSNRCWVDNAAGTKTIRKNAFPYLQINNNN